MINAHGCRTVKAQLEPDTRDARVITTEYSRGAVVKLTTDAASAPLAKYVIERDRVSGSWLCRESVIVKRGQLLAAILTDHSTHATAAEAIHTAERECERIRTGGVRDAA